MENLPEIRNAYPHLKPRALGWLRHLHRKAMTPDDWSEDGRPHEWWDQYSSPPMTSFPRFDLQESTYALGIMADQTPAWCEVYACILNELAERSITYWAAVDWLSQFGADPRRKSYPQEWLDTLMPSHLIGEYDVPGWVANGIEPWGLQPDPIGADGNLFFKGWLNLTQAMHGYMTGEDKWGEPFMVAGVERARFEWTQHRVVEHLVKQWTDSPLGPHCENTKIWTFCLSAAGLGLQLYDALNKKTTHQTYDGWLDHVKDKYFGINAAGELEWLALYYDPLKDYTHITFPHFGLAVGFYILPQSPEFAEYLYRSAVRFLQWDNAAQPIVTLSPDPRTYALGLAMAKEMGDYVVEARLRDYAERNFEPRYFGDDESEFGFWFNFGENWPRGQLSALTMVAEVGAPGAWQKLFREPNLDKFYEPRVQGVDYPSLGVAQAYNDKQAGMMQLTVYCGDPAKRGTDTSFMIANLPNSKDVKIICDGEEYADWKIISPDLVEVAATIDTHSFQIFTNYRAEQQKERKQEKVAFQRAEAAEAARTPAGGIARYIIAPKSGCGCCAAASFAR